MQPLRGCTDALEEGQPKRCAGTWRTWRPASYSSNALAYLLALLPAPCGGRPGSSARESWSLEETVGQAVEAVLQRLAQARQERSPLICVEGQPRSAALILLEMLGELHYHGDFDWAGLRIANRVFRLPLARPWRYSAADYRRECHGGSTLLGIPVEACWDPELRPAMKQALKAVHEEQMLERLLEDLTPI